MRHLTSCAARAVRSIEPTVLSEDEDELLGVPVLSPLWCSTVRSLYRGDRYRIVSRPALGPAADDRPAPDASRTDSWWGTVE